MDPFEVTMARERLRLVVSIGESIQANRWEVIRKRYGLGGDDPMTLDDIGWEMEVTGGEVARRFWLGIRDIRKRLRDELDEWPIDGLDMFYRQVCT